MNAARQVEETVELQAKLRRCQEGQADLVDKSVARSWIVNFVEHAERRKEMLALMAEWWGLTEADL